MGAPDEIVAHPVRRRIVLYLMVVGSAGIITGIASLVLSFNGGTAGQRLIPAAVLVGALFLLFLLSRTGPVDRGPSNAMGWVLCTGEFGARDYSPVLELSGDYAVAELRVQEGDWLAGRSPPELRLRDEGWS